MVLQIPDEAHATLIGETFDETDDWHVCLRSVSVDLEAVDSRTAISDRMMASKSTDSMCVSSSEESDHKYSSTVVVS